MSGINLDACSIAMGTGADTSSVIYLIDSPEHPFDASTLGENRRCILVSVPVAAWNDALTPWPAPAPFREQPDYGGNAPETLSELVQHVMPTIEARVETLKSTPVTSRAICGYSLGGLFALYAFTHCEVFDACGCLSGSAWYPGLVEHLQGLDLGFVKGRYAYFSLGTKEKRGGQPIMRTVQKRMEECVALFRERGCDVDYVLGPGNHLQQIPERLAAGLDALDAALGR